MIKHPVRLVAPWFRWQRQRNEENLAPRQSHPVFLKYDSPKLVNTFLENPQRNFKFDDDDRVGIIEPSPYTGEIRRRTGVAVRATDVWKLYRDIHKRSYLVAVEMHCDVPGLPDPAWDHICELGFVVRRWVPNDKAALRAQIGGIDKEIALLKAHLVRLDFGDPRKLLESTNPRDTLPAILNVIAQGPWAIQARKSLYESELDQLRTRRRALERPDTATWHLEYWQPAAQKHDEIGEWKTLTGSQKRVFDGEKTYPLYRLMADPRKHDHRSLGARLLFAIVPTSDMATNERGEPHFDADDTYEIRCFVRQHKSCAALRLNEADCHGPLAWSEPTDPYRIAAHFDPVGTSQFVVNVEMPDLAQLAAKPFDMTSVRMKWPQLSKPTVDGLAFPPGLSLGGGMVCCKSIPLITIVATILLEIFTPIFVALLQLYYLLYANFCFGKLPLPSLPLQMLNALAPVVPPGKLKPGNALLDEYEPHELEPIALSIAQSETAPRTRKLVYEDELTVRPRVDDPQLVVVTV